MNCATAQKISAIRKIFDERCFGYVNQLAITEKPKSRFLGPRNRDNATCKKIARNRRQGILNELNIVGRYSTPGALRLTSIVAIKCLRDLDRVFDIEKAENRP